MSLRNGLACTKLHGHVSRWVKRERELDVHVLVGGDGDEVVLLGGDADVYDPGLDIDAWPGGVGNMGVGAEEGCADVDVPGGVGGAPGGEIGRVGLAEEEDGGGEVVYAGGRAGHGEGEEAGEVEASVPRRRPQVDFGKLSELANFLYAKL